MEWYLLGVFTLETKINNKETQKEKVHGKQLDSFKILGFYNLLGNSYFVYVFQNERTTNIDKLRFGNCAICVACLFCFGRMVCCTNNKKSFRQNGFKIKENVLSENRTTARIIAFAICYAVGFLYLNSGGGDASLALILGALLGLIGYFIVGLWIIAPIIEKILDAKSRSDYRIQTINENNQNRLSAIEAQKYEDERDYLRRKRELELDFEHMKKIMELQSHLDQGKINRLADMQNQFRSNKQLDLAELKSQIESMRKGL